MRRFQYGTALSAACAALLLTGLTGCGGGGTASTQSLQAPADAPAVAADGAAKSSVRAKALDGAQEGARDEGGRTAGKNIASDVTVTAQERQVVYVARMTVRAKEVTAAVQKAKQIVTGAGGYLAKEQTNASDGGDGSAELEFKIPPARYAEVLASLGRDLGKQLSLNQGTEDVTMQVADVNSRLRSAQQALDSLRTLLKKANTIGQVLEVEREIAAREADLESLQAQQKELAAQVSMATLTLAVVGPVTVVEPPSEDPPGFLGGLATGWRALVSFAKVALTVLGVLLPWLLLVAPVVALVVLLARRAGRRRATPPARPEGAAPSARPEDAAPSARPEDAAPPAGPEAPAES
ncbi:DUF4349 domain-containing protein [Nonomuraea rhodomycinica]|uniref:DUF4349 domain-containing protein n=1 Tax=Nonomuraea rhodomycinica TaxID=1712872 RepID=A0A7Y6IR68_9ACTN|nr:DUF4349 domain-containing protein [Nonomuraea rhodomycinica]NUW42735.1 DUF4349 domain-containing protein [Nonomuraea rhodomycinica]